jgi:DNA-directed RNA polymerase II subunit RPB1
MTVMPIKGIPGVSNVEIRTQQKLVFDESDGSPLYVNNYFLDSAGSSLRNILACPYVDPVKTRSNNIQEIYETFGIEAVRNAIIIELRKVVEFDGTWVYPKHIGLLASSMTFRGFIQTIDRHGKNKDDSEGPLSKCSFEETATRLMQAAIHGEYDPCKSISSNIMFGQPIPGGTGMNKLIIDDTIGRQNANDLQNDLADFDF